MKTKWTLGAISIQTETTYEVVYKNAWGKGYLHMELDSRKDDDEWLNIDDRKATDTLVDPRTRTTTEETIEATLANTEISPYDWLRRFAKGRFKRDSNHFAYSIPGSDRITRLVGLLTNLNMYFWAILRPHAGSIDAAVHIAIINGYIEEGNARIEGGRFRGVYYAVHIVDRAIIESVIISNYIPGEECIRVREIRFVYKDYGVDQIADFRQRLRTATPHKKIIRDGWSNIGPLKGSLFNLDDRKGLPSNYPFGEFRRDESGDRIGEFTVWPPYDRTDRMTYRLCRNDEDFKRVAQILNAVEEVGKPSPGLNPAFAE